MAKRAAVYVLGCKVNQHEGEALTNLFREAGYQSVPFDDEADVYVIHTCTVTHLGDRKSRQMIRRAIRRNPQAVVAVTGCYAQTSPGEILDIEGVDLVIGTKERSRIVQLVQQVEKGTPVNKVGPWGELTDFEDLTSMETATVRAFLKVQEGCRQFCAYCIIPYARGPVRSRPLNDTVDKVRQLVGRGYQEVVLTGIHIGVYGEDLAGDINLNSLLKELVQVPGLKRLRLSSIDPNEMTEPLLDTITSEPIICPHFHIAIQSGSDEVLKRMRRPYDTAYFRQVVKQIRSRRPGVAITTDVMVGFPGETDAMFAETLAFAREMSFADMHVFKYSPRQGTPAAGYQQQVTPQVKDVRSKQLIGLANQMWRYYAANYIGRKLEVLVEQRQQDLWEGHSNNYLKVRFADSGDLRGEFVIVKPQEAKEGYLFTDEGRCV